MFRKFIQNIRASKPDIYGYSSTFLFFLFSYRDVLFRGKTLSSASTTVGSLGFSGFPGRGQIGNTTWLDPGAPPWTSQPLAAAARSQILNGHLPWWNPFGGFGFPLAANPHAAVFDPTNWISWIFPSYLQWDAHLLLAYFLGAIGTYYLTRVLGQSSIAATVSSIGFIGLGHFVTYGNHPNPAITLCALPWMLSTGYQLVKTRKLRHFFGFAFAIYWCVTAGFPETAFGCLGLTFVFLLLALFRLESHRFSSLKIVSLSTAVGFLITAPFLLGMLEFVHNSFNTHEPGMGVSRSIETKAAIPALMYPTIFGRPFSQYFSGGFQGVRDWVGIVVCILAIAGVAKIKDKQRLVGSVFFFTSAFFTFIYVFTSWIGSSIRDLPIVEQVLPIWLLPIGTFCLVVCSSFGVDALLNKSINLKKLIFFSLFYIGFFLYGFNQSRKVLAGMKARDIFNELRFPFLIMLFLITGILCVGFLQRAKVRRILLALLIMVSITSELNHYRNQNELPDRRYPYIEPQWTREVRSNSSYASSDRFFGETAISFPQTNAALGLRDIRMLDALYLDRYWNFIRTFIQPTASTRFVGGPYSELSEPLFSSVPINEMGRLARVEWLLEGGPPFHESMAFDNLFRYVITQTESNSNFQQKCVELSKTRTCGVFAHPPSSFLVPIPKNLKSFTVSYGLDQQAYRDKNSDGVQFVVNGLNHNRIRTENLLTEVISPKNNRRGWYSKQIEIKKSSTRFLQFQTASRQNSSTDWSIWGQLRSTDNLLFNMEEVTAIREEAVKVSRFSQKAPVAFVVNDVVQLPSYEAVKNWFAANSKVLHDGRLEPNFNPFETGVIETQKSVTIPNRKCGPIDINDSQFSSNGSVHLNLTSKCGGLLVLAEAYYPGWKMYINGKRSEVFPFDGVFISSVINSGISTIELQYAPTYLAEAKYALAFAFLISLVICSLQFRNRKRDF